jgi:hypothetical protein
MNENSPRQEDGKAVKAVVGPLNLLERVFKWEFGELPTKNGLKRFGAAFAGAFLGTSAIIASWFTVTSLWPALFYFIQVLGGTTSIWLLTISLAFFLVSIPASVGGWIASASSGDTSTPLTLFIRALILVVVLCLVLFLIVGLFAGLPKAVGFFSALPGIFK